VARDRASRAEAHPLRLFFAVDVPDTAKDALEAALAAHRDRVPGRWTGRGGWHVTMKFLGSTWPRLVEEVRRAGASVAGRAEPFATALTTIGAFPGGRRARVLWVGLDDPGGRFAAMAGALDEALADHFVPERRPFTPHLTVARLRPPRDVEEFDREILGVGVASGRFDADRLVLYRSHLSPAGARYEPLEAWPLGR
jgi:RNA 2',3'-cyclic 3'-phosphodiesterase